MRARQKQKILCEKKFFGVKKVTMRSNLLCDRKVPYCVEDRWIRRGGKNEREIYTKRIFYCEVQKIYFDPLGIF